MSEKSGMKAKVKKNEDMAGRTASSDAFDSQFYSNEYPDVRLGNFDPAYHYVKFGAAMRRSPSRVLQAESYVVDFPLADGENLVLHYEDVSKPMGYDLQARSLPDDAFVGVGKCYSRGNNLPKISVIMTAFNAAETVEASIYSLLQSTFSAIEILVVDDQSTDDTVERVREIEKRDPRVQLIRVAANRGTYWAKNLALYMARAPIVALSDSDDFSLPDRLEKQYDALMSDPRRLVCYADYKRVDPSGQTISNRGQDQRLGFMTMMARKELFALVGFFDSVRIAADDEFHARIKRSLDISRYCHLALPLYHALVRSDSLTAVDQVSLETTPDHVRKTSPLWFLSPTRQEYVKSYKDWHATGGDLRIPFPLRERRFAAPKIQVQAVDREDVITASVASFPPRAAKLKAVVSRILPQVDKLRVHLNNYDDVPDFLDHPKITVTKSQDYGDLRDNGKFLDVKTISDGFHFTIDDDIIYPQNYVQFLLAKILQFDRKAVVGLHGTIILPGFSRYHDGKSRKTWHFQRELRRDEPVHILGTGTVAYHTSALDFDLDDVTSTGMIDLWLARAAQQQGVPMVAVARGYKFLTEFSGDPTPTIYEERRLDDSAETNFIKTFADWRLRSPFGEPAAD